MTQLTEKIEELGTTFHDFKQRQDQRIDELETALARTSKGFEGAPINTVGPETKAMSEWLRGGPVDAKALSTTNDGQGVTVRSDWADRVFNLIRESSPMRQVANVMATDSNELEVLVDRGEAESNWTAETATRNDTSIDYMNRHKIATTEHYALPSVTQQMLEDSKLDVEAWVQGKVGNRFSRQEASAFINGDGNGKPRGILDYGTTPDADFTWGADPSAYSIGAIYTGTAGDLPADDPDNALYDLVDALKVNYLPGASFLMNRAMRNKLRKLKDSDGRSLLQPSLSETVPDRLLGYPIRIAEDMPALADGVTGILFGNFAQAYTVVDRAGVAVLRDPGYSAPGFVRWYVRKRVGGALTNPEAVKALVLGTEPA